MLVAHVEISIKLILAHMSPREVTEVFKVGEVVTGHGWRGNW